MVDPITTETMEMEDNDGLPYYIHIQYDNWGNPLYRQVSRFAKPTNNLDWQ